MHKIFIYQVFTVLLKHIKLFNSFTLYQLGWHITTQGEIVFHALKDHQAHDVPLTVVGMYAITTLCRPSTP